MGTTAKGGRMTNKTTRNREYSVQCSTVIYSCNSSLDEAIFQCTIGQCTAGQRAISRLFEMIESFV
jgi:hypothetical protein